MRCLDIGPGWDENARIPGFETLDVEKRANVDHVADAAGPLPFDDDTFDIIHASHILEHIPWQHTDRVLKEWARILKPGGWLEVWVPNGLKACRAFVAAEKGNTRLAEESPMWRKRIVGKDPCRLASGHIFSFFSGIEHPPWGLHKAMFSPRYLKKLLQAAGLINVVAMNKSEIRARDYRWINMGFKGQKPE